jgi:hypothetical protein
MFRQASKASESVRLVFLSFFFALMVVVREESSDSIDCLTLMQEKNATDAHFGQGPAEAPAKSSSGTTNTKSAQKVQPVGVMASAFTPDRATKNATQQLLQLYKSLDGKCEDDGFSVEPVDDNMVCIIQLLTLQFVLVQYVDFEPKQGKKKSGN